MLKTTNLSKFICIFIICAKSVTTEIIKDNLGKLTAINQSFYESYNRTKSNLISEEGSVLSNSATNVKFPKDKLDILLSLDTEMGKSKQKSIVPRKGVHSSMEDIEVLRNHTNEDKNNTLIVQKEPKKLEEIINNIKNVTVIGDKVTSVDLISKPNAEKNISQNTDKTEVHKKPLVLSSEVLDRITLIESDQKFIKDSHISKVTKNPNSHPGMIMPIVITMLVVPMFAVVGYLAVKRGQEAWKNRHYKRMDFLLDGMYND